jgi:hypothetical protein
MSAASLAEVIRRETTVRRNRSLLEPRSPTPTKPRSALFLPIDFVRGSDSGQRIKALGGDGFEISGIGAGLSATGLSSMIGLGLEGRLHRVPVRPGALASETLSSLAEQLARYYRIEIISVSSRSASARLVDHRRCHT